MAELANRLELEAEFARKLSRVSGRHRRELIELLGNPPDINNVPPEFWQKVEQETKQTVVAILLLLMMRSVDLHLGLIPDTFAASADQFTASAGAAAEARAGQLAANYVDHSRKMLGLSGVEWRDRLTAGETIAKQDVFNRAADIFGPVRDARIATNETTVSRVWGGEQVMWQTVGISDDDVWRNRPALSITGPCPICKPLDGTRRSYWSRFFPGGPPDPHPGCILPGQFIEATGPLVAAAKSRFDGTCVEISFSNGSRITVTENHPVLTPSGWRAANLLSERSNVICCPARKRTFSLVDPNYDGRPALIEDVFESLAMSRGVRSRSVPASPKAFHGDGNSINGNIEIVGTDRHLRRYGDTLCGQHRYQRGLVPRCDSSQLLTALCASASFLKSSFSAESGRMRGSNLLRSLAFVGGLPPHRGCLLCGSRSNAGLDDPLANDISTETALCRQMGFMFARDISLHDLAAPRGAHRNFSRQLGSLHPSLAHPLIKRDPMHAALLSECSRIFSRNVATANVIKVRRFSYSGHVFDLQVEPLGVFIVDGIAVSNCVCEIEYANVMAGGTA